MFDFVDDPAIALARMKAEDRGKPRTPGDVDDLLHGTKGGASIMAVCRLLRVLDGKNVTKRIADHELQEARVKYEVGLSWYRRQKRTRGFPASYFAPLVWVYEDSQHLVEKFHEDVFSGADLRSLSPEICLRKWLIDNTGRSGGESQKEFALRTMTGLYLAGGGPKRVNTLARFYASRTAYEYFCKMKGVSPGSWVESAASVKGRRGRGSQDALLAATQGL
jgi:hypothetical protein